MSYELKLIFLLMNFQLLNHNVIVVAEEDVIAVVGQLTLVSLKNGRL